jgi:hypothetical protein
LRYEICHVARLFHELGVFVEIRPAIEIPVRVIIQMTLKKAEELIKAVGVGPKVGTGSEMPFAE